MTTAASLRKRPSVTLPLYNSPTHRTTVAVAWAAQRELLNEAERLRLLATVTDPELLFVMFPDTTPQEKFSLASNPDTPETVLTDLAHNIGVVTDGENEEGVPLYIAVRQPHPQRAALKLLILLNPNTPDDVVAELTGEPVDVLHPRSIALSRFFGNGSVTQQVFAANYDLTPASVLTVLAEKGTPQVRVAVAMNKATPVTTLLSLHNDQEHCLLGTTAASVIASRADEIRAAFPHATADTTLADLHKEVTEAAFAPDTLSAHIRDRYFATIDED